MELLCLSSFEKVFYDGPTSINEIKNGSALIDEKYSIQFVFRGSEEFDYEIEAPNFPEINVYKVEQIPSMTPIKGETDGDFLRGVPGYFPDLLNPIESGGKIKGTQFQWHSIWVEVCSKTKLDNDEGRIKIFLNDGKEVKVSEFILEIIPVELPKQTIIHTEWLHLDCIADYYGVDVFSEKHWELIEKYILFAKIHGQNMIFTPLFTPPLDTEVGEYRRIVQLVDIKVEGTRYSFNFEKLERWTSICQRIGIEYLEFSHLFSQWGADFAPHICGEVKGQFQTIFDWNTSSTDERYCSFLNCFMNQLLNWLETNHYKRAAYFHISDEPSNEKIRNYDFASKLLKAQTNEYSIIDALSSYDFYKNGLVDVPVVATDHMSDFITNRVENKWAYYCNAQKNEVSNRFFDMPLFRTRIIGYQLYLNEVQGFLHWGYNFWYTQYSKKMIDPFLVSDAGGAFPSGDSYIVYPGKEGPLPSIRLKNIHYAMQDMRVFEKLNEYVKKEKVKELILNGESELTFSNYPRNAEWQIKVRQKINSYLKQK